MKRGTKRKLAAAGAAAAAGYVAWSRSGRSSPAPGATHLEDFVTWGEDRGRGQILGVEPYMVPADYASVGNFRAKLTHYMDAAAERGWLRPDTVAVFPEYIGSWLVALGEKRAVYEADSLVAAMRAVVSANLGPFLKAYAASTEPDRTTAAIFRMKAGKMAAAYEATFSALAREVDATIVAGSIVLPAPVVEDGHLRAGSGPLYNISATYGPDGRAYPELARKAYPINEENAFLAGASPDEMPVYATPAGPVGVLVCADSWFPAPYAALRAGGAKSVVVPSFGMHPGTWDAPWRGYSGQTPPLDWEAADVGRLSEKGAWLKYALPGRIASSGAGVGLNVYFRGRMWGMRSEYQTMAVRDGEVLTRPTGVDPGGALINLWL